MNNNIASLCTKLSFAILISALCAAPSLASPYDDDDYYDDSRDNGYDYPQDRHHEDSWKIEREKERLRNERERLEDQREDLEEQRDALKRQKNEFSAPPPAPVAEHCPSGFSPSEQKCSQEERKHGCKDMRLPGGLGCVHR